MSVHDPFVGVIVAAQKSRLGELDECLTSMQFMEHLGMRAYIVTDSITRVDTTALGYPESRFTIVDRGPELNLAHWYNLGYRAAREDLMEYAMWVETDVRIDHVDTLRMIKTIEDENRSMVGPDFYNRGDYAPRMTPGRVHVLDRIAQCFVVPTYLGDLAEMDEGYPWWAEATDLEWRLRGALEGTRLVYAPSSSHPFTGTTPVVNDPIYQAKIAQSKARFIKRWGEPHV